MTKAIKKLEDEMNIRILAGRIKELLFLGRG
ncbi:hypothetical protein [Leptotrichia trevisanii]|nr:hypothetical protein [Leptotrichia trevisanii]